MNNTIKYKSMVKKSIKIKYLPSFYNKSEAEKILSSIKKILTRQKKNKWKICMKSQMHLMTKELKAIKIKNGLMKKMLQTKINIKKNIQTKRNTLMNNLSMKKWNNNPNRVNHFYSKKKISL